MAKSWTETGRRMRQRCVTAILLTVTAALLWTGDGKAHEPITTKVMFNKEVIRVLQTNCLGCHKPGGFAPFSLLTYEEARPWAKAIKEELLEKRMPPWLAIKGYGDFQNAPVLTQREIDMIVNWVEGGAPKGDDKSLPPGPLFSNSWPMGKPDKELRLVREHRIAADADKYQEFVLPTGLKADHWLRAIDLLPGNDSVVHCATFYIQNGAPASKGAARLSLGGWAPGNIAPNYLPDGFVRRIPAGASIVARVHYKNPGDAARDLSAIGLYFADSSQSLKSVQDVAIANVGATIPAGAERHRVTASLALTDDAEAVAVMPAVHPLLVSIEVTAYCPDGTTEVLVWARGYRFGFQPTYVYKKPLSLPKGTRIEAIAYFDNSENNKYNPNSPSMPVRVSATRLDPLCILFIAPGSEAGDSVGK